VPYTYLGTPYITPRGEFTVLGHWGYNRFQGKYFQGGIFPLRGGYINPWLSHRGCVMLRVIEYFDTCHVSRLPCTVLKSRVYIRRGVFLPKLPHSADRRRGIISLFRGRRASRSVGRAKPDSGRPATPCGIDSTDGQNDFVGRHLHDQRGGLSPTLRSYLYPVCRRVHVCGRRPFDVRPCR